MSCHQNGSGFTKILVGNLIRIRGFYYGIIWFDLSKDECVMRKLQSPFPGIDFAPSLTRDAAEILCR